MRFSRLREVNIKSIVLALASVSLSVGILASPGLAAANAYGIVQPGHLEDTQWNLQDHSGYKELGLDIKPYINDFSTHQAYFYGTQVWFSSYTGNDLGVAYAGLQTNGYSAGQYIGKMLIFSVWDVNSGIAAPGGTGAPFGGEGTGYSVHMPYNWQGGHTYHMHFYISKNATTGNRLWAVSVTDLSTGVVQQIGQVYVPVSYGFIYGPVTFHEMYISDTPTSCNAISPSEVSFSNMTANGGAYKATSWSHYYQQYPMNCGSYLWSKYLGNGYVTAVGVHN